ncbi:MAG: hypothetical protein ACOYD6_01415 [Limnochordia bacterium]
MGKTIPILGGGTGGVVAANVLRKTLPQEHRIIVVDRNWKHCLQASYPSMARRYRFGTATEEPEIAVYVEDSEL